MKLPRVQDGCCCWSLKTCCFVQGYFLFLYNVVAVILSILGAVWTAQEPLETLYYRYSSTSQSYGRGGITYHTDYNYAPSWSADRRQMYRHWTIVIFCSMAFFAVLSLVSTVAFLRGIFKKQPTFLVCYINCLAVHMIVSAFTLIWASLEMAHRFPLFIHDFIKLPFFFYLLVCANSLRQEMLQREPNAVDLAVEAGRDTLPTVPSGPPPAYEKV